MYPSSAERRQKALALFQRMKECLDQNDEQGWQTARERLYQLHEHLAIYIGHRLVSQRKGLSLPDLDQECRLAALEAIAQWKPERGDLTTRLYQLLQGRTQEFARRDCLVVRPREVKPNDNEQETSQTVVSLDVIAEVGEPDDTEVRLLRAAVRQAVARLPRRQRRVTQLYYGLEGEQRNLREIGQELGITAQGARAHLQKAIPQLKSELAGVI